MRNRKGLTPGTLRFIVFSAVVSASVYCAFAWAQPPASLIGDWNVTFKTLAGKTYEGRLSLTETGGTYRTYVHTYDVCDRGRPWDIKVEPMGRRLVWITVLRKRVIEFCPDYTIAMRLIEPDKALGRNGTTEYTFVRRK